MIEMSKYINDIDLLYDDKIIQQQQLFKKKTLHVLWKIKRKEN